jgi:hypothetical protein
MTIDSTTASIYVHEIRNQCNYVQASLEMFNQAMEKGQPVAILYSAQNMLQHAATLARTLFPLRNKAAKHAEALRGMLAIDDSHALNNKQLLHIWDNPEDRMEDWIEKSRERFVVMDYVGPFGMVGDQQVEGLQQSDVFRQVDPDNLNFIFRGEVFALQGIAHAVADIDARIKQLHEQMFPEAKGTADNGAGTSESETSEPNGSA